MKRSTKATPPARLKLNLGCGYDHRAGYVNLDVDPATHPDLVHDLYQPLPYTDNSVSEILLQDVLEHFTLQDGYRLLLECQRVLQAQGKLKVRVPNVTAIWQKYHQQPDVLHLFIYGDTSKSGVWGAHKAGYDPASLARVLETTELSISDWATDDTNFRFTLKKTGPHQLVYTVPGHQPAPVLPSPLYHLENPRHSGQASYLLATNWLEYLLTPWWRWQGKKVIWLVGSHQFGFSSSWEQRLSKLLLRPLMSQLDRLFLTTINDAWIGTELLRFSHLRTYQLPAAD
jgi:hypothetical protein